MLKRLWKNMTPYLFLDIDGVLNDHTYSGIDRDKTAILNTVLERFIDLKIVLSSAWRQEIIQGHMDLHGFETMLRACGLSCYNRLVGHTDDGTDFEYGGRANLIQRYAKQHGLTRWVAIDDMGLALPSTHFVQTNGQYGITQAKADAVIAILNNCHLWSAA